MPSECLLAKFNEEIESAARYGEKNSALDYFDLRQFAAERLLGYAANENWFGRESKPLTCEDDTKTRSLNELRPGDVLVNGNLVVEVTPLSTGRSVYVETRNMDDEDAQVFYYADEPTFVVIDDSSDIHVRVQTALNMDILNYIRQDIREQGILGMKADQSFDAALNSDPANWEARFWKAAAMSYWPPQLGKGKEVLERFVDLINWQETKAPEPQYAQTYVLLGEQYEKQGYPAYAVQTWQRGASLFPNDSRLGQKLSAPPAAEQTAAR